MFDVYKLHDSAICCVHVAKFRYLLCSNCTIQLLLCTTCKTQLFASLLLYVRRWPGARRWAVANFLLNWPAAAVVGMAVYVLCVVLTPHCKVCQASACGDHHTDSSKLLTAYQWLCTGETARLFVMYVTA